MAEALRGSAKSTAFVVLFAAAAILAATAAHAQSSLGIGNAEPAIAPAGPLAGLFQWINQHQQSFYRAMTDALRGMREDGSRVWILVGLSFVYGVFHAAGPGHGKAVISSYMLANEVALRRGVMLSFISAFLQAVTAIVVMGMVFLFLRGTAFSAGSVTRFLEIGSFALVTAFGAWLLWRKLGPRLFSRLDAMPARSLSAAHVPHGHDHDHHHHHGGTHHHHEHGPGEVCETCGHAHAPDPSLLAGDRFTWTTAWSAVAAVGIRPCSGALIVLTFAFLNGLWLGGIVSVFAMSFGTAITVSTLAVLAVSAKNWAVAIAGGGTLGSRVHDWIEIGGALMVLLLGLLLLSAALMA